MRVGFIGLGSMGSGMAANLVRAGHEVAVFNRSRDKAGPLADLGATVAGSIADACQGEAVVTMLADDHAAESVVLGDGGIAASLPKQSVHISCSTIGVALSRRMADAHAANGQRYVSAPVFGRPDAAASAKLVIMAGGPAGAIDAVRPLLDAMGQRTFTVAAQAEAANLVKLSGNFLIASVIESLGEAIGLVSKGGVDAHAYLELLTSTLFNAPVYKTYGNLIASEEAGPVGFTAPLGLKDVTLALAAAEALGASMPVAELLQERFRMVIDQGGKDQDWSVIGRMAAGRK
jgi:3-hydroxyisobutyrate dehydrogenase-like beta-hydroxyacid dehydrogenase